MPQLSTLDGWWAEGYMGLNGWAIPRLSRVRTRTPWMPHASIDLLEQQIVPMYYTAATRVTFRSSGCSG